MTHVTEVLDYLTEPELLAWMLRMSPKKRETISEESKAIGTRVDLLIQRDILPPSSSGEASALSPLPPGLEAQVASCIAAWGVFKEARPDIIRGIKDIQIELQQDGIVGHPDIFYEDSEKWGIIDVKSSKTMYPKYWTQTAIYTELKRLSYHFDTYLKKPRFIGVLRLDKESGKPYYLEINNEAVIQYEVGVFNAYRVAYEHAFKNREFIRQQLEGEII